jgi:predicted PurR-regulated permease PerM
MADMLGSARRPFYALAFVALLVLCLSLTRDAAVPLAVAVMVWFLIGAMARAIRSLPGVGRRVPGWLARTVAVLVLFGALALVAHIVAQAVSGQWAGIESGLGDPEAVVLDRLGRLAGALGVTVSLSPAEVIDLLALDTTLAWAIVKARTLVTDVSLVVLYVMFLLADERYFDAKLRMLFPDPERRARLSLALHRIAAETRAYLWLMTLISAGVAVATYAICAAVGLPGAALWGLLAFALNFVPTIGSIAAVVAPVLYSLVTLEDPLRVLALVAALGLVQFVAGEVVLPRVMGDRLNLSSVVVLLVLVVWGAVWGPAGMFLAIPLTVILTLVCARFDATRPIAVVLSRDGHVPQV